VGAALGGHWHEAGEIVFEQRDVEIPAFWSQQATISWSPSTSAAAPGRPSTSEASSSLIGRVVTALTAWGREQKYFAGDADLQAFSDDLKHILVYQKAAFNSPVWFNCGFEQAPQCSACFINSVQDTMDSILTLARTEGMLFKFGRAPAPTSRRSARRASRSPMAERRRGRCRS